MFDGEMKFFFCRQNTAFCNLPTISLDVLLRNAPSAFRNIRWSKDDESITTGDDDDDDDEGGIDLDDAEVALLVFVS